MKRAIEEVLAIRVPLAVVLAEKTMTLGQVLALGPGTVVEFDKSVAAALDLYLGERRVASGKAVRIGENFGLQVSEIVDPRQTLEGLGA
ncbi:MAG: FliM/FliN family flagellar motor C-terminal domain-containing protein [Planctomycetes bacterium]|nr:FliM/FliN family flagellar motor C-terminal domain-containing protein [Planctomycetota bacterium]